MNKAIGIRLSDELQAKIRSEAEQKKLSVAQIIRQKIEWAYALEGIKELKADLEKLEAVVSEMAPQLRRAENLSWWTLIMLAEFIKSDLGNGQFWSIEKSVDEKYKAYLQTRELKF
jgi:predicted transcriptional regulator